MGRVCRSFKYAGFLQQGICSRGRVCLPAQVDLGSLPELGSSPGEGNGSPFQYPCLENPMDRGAWRPTVHGVAEESDTSWRLNSNNKTPRCCVCPRTSLWIRPKPPEIIFLISLILSYAAFLALSRFLLSACPP